MSDFFEKVKGSLFPPESKPHQPLIHEIIERSEDEMRIFQAWKKSIRKEQLLNSLSGWLLKTPGCQNSTQFARIVNEKAANGFVVYCENEYLSQVEAQHFTDYLKEKIEELGYSCQLSDSRTFIKDGSAESSDRYFLKPPNKPSFFDEPLNQEFGNVLIQCQKVDEKPIYIKLMRCFYQDRKYLKPRTFEDLLKHLLA